MSAYSMASMPNNCQPFFSARALPSAHRQKVRANNNFSSSRLKELWIFFTCTWPSSFSSKSRYGYVMPGLQGLVVGCVWKPLTLSLDAPGTLSSPLGRRVQP